MSNLIIKNKVSNALKMNESADGKKKYVFEGPFTICGVKNRNERIYDEDEVLKHLAYLREKIKKEGCILGELDHPEGRFEIYLQDVSHKITDLWYVPESKTVMGRLELMPTEKGKIMMAMVDAGCPLYVSSRAAGTVNADSHVSIQQIFTYDIVATPGFEQCKLDSVSESFRTTLKTFINESLEADKNKINKAKKYGFLDENIEIIETDSEIPELKESKNTPNIDMNKLTKPLVEDIQVKVTPEKARELGLKLDGGDNTENNSEDAKPSADDILEITPTYAEQDTSAIEDIQPEFQSADSASQNTEGSTETQGAKPEDDENPFMTESCKGKKCAKKESQKEKYSEEKDLDECGDISEEDETPNPVTDGKKGSETDKVMHKNNKSEESNESEKTINAIQKEKNSVKESTKKSLEYYQSLLEEHKIKAQIKQSIIDAYPFSISLSESNFTKFTQLSDEDKMTCAKYIFENQIFDIKAINEQFMRPLFARINEQKNYIRLADKSDLELYNLAPRALKESIDKMAEMFILENKADVDEFWSRTGIRNFVKNKVNNETFVQNYNEKMAVSEDEDDIFFGVRV